MTSEASFRSCIASASARGCPVLFTRRPSHGYACARKCRSAGTRPARETVVGRMAEGALLQSESPVTDEAHTGIDGIGIEELPAVALQLLERRLHAQRGPVWSV